MKTNRRETLRYLGVKGAPDERTLALVERAEKEAEECVFPRFTFRLFPLEREPLSVGGTPLEGADIAAYLKDCDEVYLIAATLGFEAEKRINFLMQSSPALGVALDAVCTSVLESFLDEQCQKLQEGSKKRLKPRFSCGYGDFPLSQQRDMVRLLDTGRKIGVFLSESLMLAPQKSVTALVGAGERARGKSEGCSACGKKDCAFKKELR